MVEIGLGGAAGVILLTAVVMAWRREQRQKRRDQRLAAAFERARRVAQTGTGEQGKPYTVYSESTWRY